MIKTLIRFCNFLFRCLSDYLKRFSAEREGFEPPEPRSSTVFKTAAIDHSAISPNQEIHEASLNGGANIRIFSKWTMQQDDRV